MSIKPASRNEYKLSKENRSDIEIYSLKLTDSALKALETVSSKQQNAITISINGNRGTLSIPGKEAFLSYDLNISPLTQTSDGTVDVIQFLGSRAINMGKIVSKMTVQANADSFSTAKLRMVEAEDHRKGYSKPSIMPSAKRSCMLDGVLNPRSVPTPPRSRNPESKISPSSVVRSYSPSTINMNKSPAIANPEVGARPLRDRIIHLLAVQSYQRPELLLRLKRDGLTDEQKDKVDSILSKVGRTGRQGEFHLSPTFINLVEQNWPGYSPSDRSIVASLKAKMSTNSPMNANNRVTPSSRQNSPLTAAPLSTATAVASLDDFRRKPTRASAPSAPHPLSKKIAALDLLASGLSLASVANRHGITPMLLESWKNNEAVLRQRHAQRLGSTNPQTATASLSSSHEASKNVSNSDIAAADWTSSSKPSASKRARVSSNEGGSAPSISGNSSFQSSSSLASRRPGTAAAAPSLSSIPPGLNSFKDLSPQSLNKRSPSNRKRPYDALLSDSCCGDDQLRRSDSTLPPRPIGSRPAGIHQCRPHDRGSETSSCGDSCSPPVEATPLSQFYAHGAAIDPKIDKGQRLYPCNDEKASEEEYLNCSISSKNAEVERLYPPISNAKQAASYREDFESLYPQYLRLYDHIRRAWNKVIALKDRIMKLAGGPDADQITHLATELDEFLNSMKKPERREEEVRLIAMTFKLQHLKQRINAYSSQEGTETTAASGTCNGIDRNSEIQLQRSQNHNGLLRAGASN